MSTKAIEMVLEWAARGARHPYADAANTELAAIKKACRIVDEHGVVHSMRFDESKEDDELNDAADLLSAIGRPTEES